MAVSVASPRDNVAVKTTSASASPQVIVNLPVSASTTAAASLEAQEIVTSVYPEPVKGKSTTTSSSTLLYPNVKLFFSNATASVSLNTGNDKYSTALLSHGCK